MLEDTSFHPGRSGINHLRVLAAAGGHPASRVDELIDLVALRGAESRRVGQYSQGMRQRLAIASALIGDPGILILDEPTNGLDPGGIRWLRDLMRRLAGEGRAVLVSSHLLAEVAQAVDDVVVIAKGELRARGSLQDVLGDGGAPVTDVRSPYPDHLRESLTRRGHHVERGASARGPGGQRGARAGRHRRRRGRLDPLPAYPASPIAGGHLLRAHGRRRSARREARAAGRADQAAHDAHVLRADGDRSGRCRSSSSRCSPRWPTDLDAERRARRCSPRDFTGLFILLLGAIGMAGELRHRTIASTVLSAPRRLVLMAAKLAAYAAAGVLLSLLVNLAIMPVGALILSARDEVTLSFGDLLDILWRNLVVAAFFGPLGVCVGTLIRNQAGVIVALLA